MQAPPLLVQPPPEGAQARGEPVQFPVQQSVPVVQVVPFNLQGSAQVAPLQ